MAQAAGDFVWSDDLSFLARFRLAHTENLSNTTTNADGDEVTTDGFTAARFVEATAGWAYRPLAADWLDLLFRYSFLLDQRPVGAAGEALTQRSHVLAIAPVVQLPWRLKVSGKLAWKRTEANAELLTDQILSSQVNAMLALARVAWGFTAKGKWELALEYRVLRLVYVDGGETKQGVLLEAAYNVNRYVRLGVGWNFSHFADDELGDLERDGYGFFLRVVGRF